jgi:2-hydroxychromene-2-carboxylate isomerase
LTFVDGPRFFFGAMSPYSWFAAEPIDGLIPEARWIPVFAGALFRANGRGTWGLTERREAGLADCEARAAAHGLGPKRLAQAIADQTIKDSVRANHDEAIALGVFGVPTIVLRDGRAFWGDDRLEEAAAAANGS